MCLSHTFAVIGALLRKDDDVEGFDPGTSFGHAMDSVTLEVCQYDPVTQVLDKNHVRIGADGIILSPISLRQAYPAEFDLMARIAGLRLRDRWGGWNGEPFTTASWRHVSVYERVG
jgi:hypothetical protein